MFTVGYAIPSYYSEMRVEKLLQCIASVRASTGVTARISVSFTNYPAKVVDKFRPLIHDVVIAPTGTSLSNSRNMVVQPFAKLKLDAIAHSDDDEVIAPDALYHSCSILQDFPTIGMVLAFIFQKDGSWPSRKNFSMWKRDNVRTAPWNDSGYLCTIPHRVHFKRGINQMWEANHIWADEDVYILCRMYEQGLEVVASPLVKCWHYPDSSGMGGQERRIVARNHDATIMKRRFGDLVNLQAEGKYPGFCSPVLNKAHPNVTQFDKFRYQKTKVVE